MSNLANDNVYPNSGEPWMPTTPKEVIKSNETQREETLAQLPLLKEQIAHFDKQIAFYDSTKSIPDVVLVQPAEFMHVVAAHKLLIPILEAERNFLVKRVESVTEE